MSEQFPLNHHATCLHLSWMNHCLGVLLVGPSGCGKSSLALQLIDQHGYGLAGGEAVTAELVSDDQVELTVDNGILTARSPQRISGLIEVRGIGVLKLPGARSSTVPGLIVQHASASEIQRLPEAGTTALLGFELPLHLADFSAPDAPARIRVLAQLAWNGISTIG